MSPETERALAAQRQQMQASLGEVIRQVKADAWDEGKTAVHDFQAHMNQIPGRKPPTNPYREGASDADA